MLLSLMFRASLASSPHSARSWKNRMTRRLIPTPTRVQPSTSSRSATRAARPSVGLSCAVARSASTATTERCLAAIEAAADSPEQVVVVEQPAFSSPAAARIAGSLDATGDVLVFVDADVEIHEDAFTRIRDSFADSSELTALFGSYDD